MSVSAVAIIYLVYLISTGRGLSNSIFNPLNSKHFTFGENSATGLPPSNLTNNQVLPRQLISGTVLPIIPTQIPILANCRCVPPGQCPVSPTPGLPNDGAGQIDIRIVNNPGIVTPPITTIAPCNYGLIRCCQPGAYQCGLRFPPPPGSAISGPGQAAFGSFPWQAAILTVADVYLGSGALITPNFVLTAAHKINNVPIATFKVRLGEWDAASVSEPIPAEDITITQAIIHPNFNPSNLQNDVALLRLSRNVDLTAKSTIGTICLPNIPSFAGQRCFVSGWGKNDFGPNGLFQAIQKQVDVPVITPAQCQAALSSTRLGLNFLLNTASFICAGGENGKDACTGDGGSPLVCLNGGRWYLAGLVAWGIGCAVTGIPGVYVNIPTYLPWIQTIIAS